MSSAGDFRCSVEVLDFFFFFHFFLQMSDKASYPTASIAWMSQAYDTTSSTSSSIEQRSRTVNSPSFSTMNPSSTITSLER